MSLTTQQTQALYKLYPNVVYIVGSVAYDEQGDEVSYGLQAVETKVLEMQAEEEAKTQTAHDKLAALGITPEDLQRILGVK